MKLSILFFAILGVSAAAALPAGKVLDRSTRSLDNDLAEFALLFPVEDALLLLIQYLAEDPEVQAVIEYVQSEDFIQLVLAVEAIPEYIALLDLLEAGGLAVYDTVNMLHSLLGIPDLVKASRTMSRLVSTRITGGVAGLIDDMKAILPLAKIRALYDEKCKTSEDFAALVAMIASDEFQAGVAQVKAHKEYQAIRAKALELGIDVEAVAALLWDLLGFPSA